MAKNLILGLIQFPWVQIQATNFFSKNLALSVTRYHSQLSLCTISEKTNDPILRKFSDGRIDRGTDRRMRVISQDVVHLTPSVQYKQIIISYELKSKIYLKVLTYPKRVNWKESIHSLFHLRFMLNVVYRQFLRTILLQVTLVTEKLVKLPIPKPYLPDSSKP